MESQAFVTCFEELSKSRPSVLATILRQSGSAPRGAGATMAVLANGRTVGTVGGGALEYEITQMCAALLREGRSALREFRLTAADPLGMVCGGDVTVLCQYCGPGDEQMRSLGEALSAFDRHKKPGGLWLARQIYGGGSRVKTGLCRPSGPLTADCPGGEDTAALCRRQPGLSETGDGLLFVQPLVLAGRTWVFGGGHVARKLVPLLDELDFAPAVFEDRPEYVTTERFPHAEELVLGSFAAIAERIKLTEEDGAVIMTRGHVHDNALLTQVLRSPAWYVGLMGSRSKIQGTAAFLRGEGFSDEDIARLHTPVGLTIGAETPAEIAVSVAAEMVLCRARRDHSQKLDESENARRPLT